MVIGDTTLANCFKSMWIRYYPQNVIVSFKLIVLTAGCIISLENCVYVTAVRHSIMSSNSYL